MDAGSLAAEIARQVGEADRLAGLAEELAREIEHARTIEEVRALAAELARVVSSGLRHRAGSLHLVLAALGA